MAPTLPAGLSQKKKLVPDALARIKLDDVERGC